VVVECGGRDRT
jgi:hypothetical protein